MVGNPWAFQALDRAPQPAMHKGPTGPTQGKAMQDRTHKHSHGSSSSSSSIGVLPCSCSRTTTNRQSISNNPTNRTPHRIASPHQNNRSSTNITNLRCFKISLKSNSSNICSGSSGSLSQAQRRVRLPTLARPACQSHHNPCRLATLEIGIVSTMGLVQSQFPLLPYNITALLLLGPLLLRMLILPTIPPPTISRHPHKLLLQTSSKMRAHLFLVQLFNQ